MARSRNIKPGFFRNEDLLEMPISYRLLFIGLWTIADRAGRLEDRPKRIKIEVFPADDVDVDDGLLELEKAGLIVRYMADESRFIAIPSWGKHQNPHHREARSTIPPPGKPRPSPGKAQGKPEASPGPGRAKAGTGPGVAVLIHSIKTLPETDSLQGEVVGGDSAKWTS